MIPGIGTGWGSGPAWSAALHCTMRELAPPGVAPACIASSSAHVALPSHRSSTAGLAVVAANAAAAASSPSPASIDRVELIIMT